MTKNFNLFRASAHLLEAGKYLTEIDEEKKAKILDIAKELVDCIEIREEDKKNADEIKKYADEIRSDQ